MIITYHGDNYFRLQAGDLVVLLNPTNLRSAKGALALISTVKPSTAPQTNETVWIDHQGEYEIKEVRLKGWSNDNDGKFERTVYSLEMDDLKTAILVGLTKEPEERIAKSLKGSDIAIVTIEKRSPLKEETVARLLKNIHPGLIIFGANDLKTVLKDFKKNNCDKMEKLVIKKKDINPNETKIVCLKT
jgi:hypothetical protein